MVINLGDLKKEKKEDVTLHINGIYRDVNNNLCLVLGKEISKETQREWVIYERLGAHQKRAILLDDFFKKVVWHGKLQNRFVYLHQF